MISKAFLQQLHCAYCGFGFVLETILGGGDENAIRNGIIRCACYRYPIIDGIAILKQQSAPSDTNDRLVERLDCGDTAGALHLAIATSPVSRLRSRRERLRQFLLRRDDPSTNMTPDRQSFAEALHAHRPAAYADYLFHRFANNSLLAALPLLALLKEVSASHPATGEPARVLDLNCGTGHASFLITALFPDLSVIATDHDFVNLYLAQRYVCPRGSFLCLDAEVPLPFGDATLDAVLCMDGLHYVRSKRALIKELSRSTTEPAIWLFPHLHNALEKNFSPGCPLRPEEYQRCFEPLRLRMLVELDVLRDFVRERRLNLSQSPSKSELDKAPVLSVVASRRPDLWHVHHDVATLLEQQRRNVMFNPIYSVTDDGNVI